MIDLTDKEEEFIQKILDYVSEHWEDFCNRSNLDNGALISSIERKIYG